MKIDKISFISTKSGDSGETKDYSNQKYLKSDVLFEVIGTIDELSSFLGLSYHYTKIENIIRIQKDLQMINSLIATPPDSKQYNNLQKLEEENISWLEKEMQLVLDIKPLEPRFTLPGSEKSVEGAYLDVCRTLSRRAERRLVDFVKKHNREDLSLVNKYINRLSDYLYVLSCNI